MFGVQIFGCRVQGLRFQGAVIRVSNFRFRVEGRPSRWRGWPHVLGGLPHRCTRQHRGRGAVPIIGTVPNLMTTTKNNYFAEMWSDSEVGSYLRLMDFGVTEL